MIGRRDGYVPTRAPSLAGQSRNPPAFIAGRSLPPQSLKSPAMTTAVTGRWTTGSPRLYDAVHPFRKSVAELRVGDTIASTSRTVTLEDIDHFAEFTGDTFYAHTDEEAAAANPFFEGRVAHGYFVVSLAAGLFVSPEPGPVLANYGLERLRFLTPVYPGDALRVAQREIIRALSDQFEGGECRPCPVHRQAEQ